MLEKTDTLRSFYPKLSAEPLNTSVTWNTNRIQEITDRSHTNFKYSNNGLRIRYPQEHQGPGPCSDAWAREPEGLLLDWRSGL